LLWFSYVLLGAVYPQQAAEKPAAASANAFLSFVGSQRGAAKPLNSQAYPSYDSDKDQK